jgi:hypothetical protein
LKVVSNKIIRPLALSQSSAFAFSGMKSRVLKRRQLTKNKRSNDLLPLLSLIPRDALIEGPCA